jgi:tripartite-type tricarboxylate transporter receptor subunit TctC
MIRRDDARHRRDGLQALHAHGAHVAAVHSPRRRRIAAALAGAAVVLVAGRPRAQGFPSKPLRIVVPFPPGGSTDLLARRIGEKLAAALGQSVVVENRPGAGGATGSVEVARAAADG